MTDAVHHEWPDLDIEVQHVTNIASQDLLLDAGRVKRLVERLEQQDGATDRRITGLHEFHRQLVGLSDALKDFT